MAAFHLSLSLLALIFAVSAIVSESRVARKDLGVDIGGVGVETGGVGLGLGGSGSGVLNHHVLILTCKIFS